MRRTPFGSNLQKSGPNESTDTPVGVKEEKKKIVKLVAHTSFDRSISVRKTEQQAKELKGTKSPLSSQQANSDPGVRVTGK